MLNICLVEDDEALRSTLSLFFDMLGDTKYVIAKSLIDLQTREVTISTLDVAILDVNLGANQPDGVQVYQWLVAHGFRGRIIFISGHARSHPKVVEACQIQGAVFLEKPIDIDEFSSVIKGDV